MTPAGPVRPAVLQGRRVDLWPAADWLRLRPHDRPAGGFWRSRNPDRLLAALDGDQSEAAAIAAGRVTVRLDDARAAEAGRARRWTTRLVPVPPSANLEMCVPDA